MIQKGNVSNGVKVLACIPARYGSTRFAGKVLAKDTGKFLIQHTYEQARLSQLVDKVIIAADDERIAAAAKTFGAECVLTSAEHKTGTDRIAEAIRKIADSGQWIADRKTKLNAIRYTLNANDIVVNLQADEPQIDPKNIDFLAQLLIETQNSNLSRAEPRELKTQNYGMATLATDFQNAEQIKDPNIVKVVISSCIANASDKRLRRTPNGGATSHGIGRAIYFSRAPIPYDRKSSGVGKAHQYLRHIGIYAYSKEFLLKITALPQTKLEKIEKLEQLRTIEYGFPILVGKVEQSCESIDTPQQYAEFVERYKKNGE